MTMKTTLSLSFKTYFADERENMHCIEIGNDEMRLMLLVTWLALSVWLNVQKTVYFTQNLKVFWWVCVSVQCTFLLLCSASWSHRHHHRYRLPLNFFQKKSFKVKILLLLKIHWWLEQFVRERVCIKVILCGIQCHTLLDVT